MRLVVRKRRVSVDRDRALDVRRAVVRAVVRRLGRGRRFLGNKRAVCVVGSNDDDRLDRNLAVRLIVRERQVARLQLAADVDRARARRRVVREARRAGNRRVAILDVQRAADAGYRRRGRRSRRYGRLR